MLNRSCYNNGWQLDCFSDWLNFNLNSLTWSHQLSGSNWRCKFRILFVSTLNEPTSNFNISLSSRLASDGHWILGSTKIVHTSLSFGRVVKSDTFFFIKLKEGFKTIFFQLHFKLHFLKYSPLKNMRKRQKMPFSSIYLL